MCNCKSFTCNLIIITSSYTSLLYYVIIIYIILYDVIRCNKRNQSILSCMLLFYMIMYVLVQFEEMRIKLWPFFWKCCRLVNLQNWLKRIRMKKESWVIKGTIYLIRFHSIVYNRSKVASNPHAMIGRCRWSGRCRKRVGPLTE